MPELAKEKLTQEQIGINSPEKRQTEVVDIQERTVHPPKEVETWLMKVERMAPPSVNDPTTGKPILQPTINTMQTSYKTLPVTRSVFVAGFSKTITNAGRWLSAFWWRMVKKNPDAYQFKEQ